MYKVVKATKRFDLLTQFKFFSDSTYLQKDCKL